MHVNPDQVSPRRSPATIACRLASRARQFGTGTDTAGGARPCSTARERRSGAMCTRTVAASIVTDRNAAAAVPALTGSRASRWGSLPARVARERRLPGGQDVRAPSASADPVAFAGILHPGLRLTREIPAPLSSASAYPELPEKLSCTRRIAVALPVVESMSTIAPWTQTSFSPGSIFAVRCVSMR